MTYRGVISNGVVIVEGEKLPDGTVVEIRPLITGSLHDGSIASHAAVGIWKDRTDLPDNSVEASRVLREKLMRRTDE